MKKFVFEVMQAIDQVHHVIRTTRYGDHITVKYWDMTDDEDMKRYQAYIKKNANLIVTKIFL